MEPFPQLAARWMINIFLGILNKRKLDITDSPVTPDQFGDLLIWVHSRKVTEATAKQVLENMFDTGKCATDIILEDNSMAYDSRLVKQVCEGVIAANEQKAVQYRNGKEKLFGFFIGQVMDCLGNKAFPEDVNKYVRAELVGSSNG